MSAFQKAPASYRAFSICAVFIAFFCSAVQLVSGILSLELLLLVQPEPVLQALSSVHLSVRSLVLLPLVLLPLVLLS